MLNKVSAVLISALYLSVSAFPALSGDDFGPTSTETKIFNRSVFATAAALKQQGVNATRVEQWGQYVLAFVTDENGSTSMQFFDKDTLKRVAL